MALIGQASHQRSEHVSIRGVLELSIVFGLIWIAWVNGSLYVGLHSREFADRALHYSGWCPNRQPHGACARCERARR
ncbi:MAG: hypothetical protein JO023_17040 [Chloroflexi bacterium]|nr:hypothetical protein [Chloroflexota bacterium]